MRHEIFDLVLILSSVYALIAGGFPERFVCVTLAAGDLLTVLMLSDRSHRFHHVEWGVAAVDFCIFMVLLYMALASCRWWPIVLAGLQLDGLVVHGVRITAPESLPLSYFDASAIWAYVMLAVLVGGTWRHRVRVAIFEDDPAWKTQFENGLFASRPEESSGTPPTP